MKPSRKTVVLDEGGTQYRVEIPGYLAKLSNIDVEVFIHREVNHDHIDGLYLSKHHWAVTDPMSGLKLSSEGKETREEAIEHVEERTNHVDMDTYSKLVLQSAADTVDLPVTKQL